MKDRQWQERRQPTELERARIRRVLAGKPAGKGAQREDAILDEVRALRGDVAELRELLAAFIAEQGAPAFTDEVLTRRGAAEMLQVCVETIGKWVKCDGLPCKRVGNEYRFLRSEIAGWLEARDAMPARQYGPPSPEVEAVERVKRRLQQKDGKGR